MRAKKLITATTGGAVLFGSLVTAASTAQAAHDGGYRGKVVRAQLTELNDSGVSGHARVAVQGKRLGVNVDASGLLAGMPHAVHIHYGEQATHECPTMADDANSDGRVNVVEGVPRYGPIAVSLTTSGDTSPASGLAVSRYSTAPGGMIDYQRRIATSREVAKAIARGEGVVVVHGVDYNGNGMYDFEGAGASELNGAVPAEATDPAACGVLKTGHHGHKHKH